MEDLRLKVFWIIHIVMLALFVVELLFVLSIWFKARVPGVPLRASRWRKLFAAIGIVLGLVFSRRIWPLIKSLVLDGMIHRRLFRTNKKRWLVHIAVFGSFLVLGIVSTITGVVVEFLPLFGMSPEKAASIPVIGQTFHADVWWVALVNELLGLIVLGGMILIIIRRYVAKDPQLRTVGADTALITLLTLVAAGGFLAETFRLLADYTTTAGVFAPNPAMLPADKLPEVLYRVWRPEWGFVGYALAWLLGLLKIGPDVWAVFHNIFFWLHFVIVTALLYYLPFSRFFHVIMSPVIVAYNTMRDGEALRAQEHGGHALRPVSDRATRTAR